MSRSRYKYQADLDEAIVAAFGMWRGLTIRLEPSGQERSMPEPWQIIPSIDGRCDPGFARQAIECSSVWFKLFLERRPSVPRALQFEILAPFFDGMEIAHRGWEIDGIRGRCSFDPAGAEKARETFAAILALELCNASSRPSGDIPLPDEAIRTLATQTAFTLLGYFEAESPGDAAPRHFLESCRSPGNLGAGNPPGALLESLKQSVQVSLSAAESGRGSWAAYHAAKAVLSLSAPDAAQALYGVFCSQFDAFQSYLGGACNWFTGGCANEPALSPGDATGMLTRRWQALQLGQLLMRHGVV